MRRFAVAVAALQVAMAQPIAAARDFSTVEGLKSFIENLLMSALPDPIGDVVAVLKASPEIVRHAVGEYFRAQATAAENEGCDLMSDWYMAIYSCLRNDACRDLETFKAAHSVPKDQAMCRKVPFARSWTFYNTVKPTPDMEKRAIGEWHNGVLLATKIEGWGPGEFSRFAIARQSKVECKVDGGNVTCTAAGRPCRCR